VQGHSIKDRVEVKMLNVLYYLQTTWAKMCGKSLSKSAPCSFGLSATSQQYFSLRTNQPAVTSQQCFSLRTNQHHQPNEQAAGVGMCGRPVPRHVNCRWFVYSSNFGLWTCGAHFLLLFYYIKKLRSSSQSHTD
jgi:hypothetical protein